MPLYLDEDLVGQDPAEICYPHLLLCMGVTVLMQDGSLVGAHFTKPAPKRTCVPRWSSRSTLIAPACTSFTAQETSRSISLPMVA